eukprot:PhF_6_TR13852/c0_g1_i2/m.22211
MALKRLTKELRELNSCDHPWATVTLDKDGQDLFHWFVTLYAHHVPDDVACRHLIKPINVEINDVDPSFHFLSNPIFMGCAVPLLYSFPTDYPFRPYAITFTEGFSSSIQQWMDDHAAAISNVPSSESLEISLEAHLLVQQQDLSEMVLHEANARRLINQEEQGCWNYLSTLVQVAHSPQVADISLTIVIDSNVVTFEGTTTTTLQDLAEYLVFRCFIDCADRCYIIYSGKRLERYRTLGDYNITSGAKIQVLRKLSPCQHCKIGGIMFSEKWTPYFTVMNKLPHVIRSIFYELPTEFSKSCHWGKTISPLFFDKPDVVHWAMREVSPSPSVFSEDNKGQWPILFLRRIAALFRIRVRGTTRLYLPKD